MYKSLNMPIETFLTRKLEIRFIDARNLATEAKVGMGIVGYAAPEQEHYLIEEAVKIFEKFPDESKMAMRRLKTDLDAVTKPPRVSLSKIYSSLGSDGTSITTDQSLSDESATSKKRFNMRPKKLLWMIHKNQI
jgi:hypothetical protein